MVKPYLTVLGLWTLLGAFICQNEAAAPAERITSPTKEKDEGVSRRELARSLREQKSIRIIFSAPEVPGAPALQSLAERMKKAFPEDWNVSCLPEEEISRENLENIPIVLLGRQFKNPEICRLLDQLPFKSGDSQFSFFGQSFDQPEFSFRLFLYPNPYDHSPLFVIGGNSESAIIRQFPGQAEEDWSNLFWRSWGYEIYQGNGVRVRGNFEDRSWAIHPDHHFDFRDREVSEYISKHFRFNDLAGLGQPRVMEMAAHFEGKVRELRSFTGSRNEIAPIHYFIYPSIEEKGLRLMNTQEGHTEKEDREIHVVIDPTFSGQHSHQEIRLILSDLLGESERSFLYEGLAAHFNPHWQERGAPYWAARLFQSGNLPPLAELVDDELFRRESPLVMTAAAGSLAGFLMEYWGTQIFLDNYRKWPVWSKAEWLALEKEWHQFLKAKAPRPELAAPVQHSYYRGFNFAHEGYQIYNGYGSGLARQSLEKLATLGTNAVAIVPYGFQRDPHQPAFLGVRHGPGSENDESVIYAHAQAQALGMQTLLKPQLWVSGSWPGEVAMTSDEDWHAFFDYYYRWIRHYALLAEIRGFDAFCVGVEFSQAALQKPEAWREIISRIRGIYSGPITYASNWGEEFEKLSFWDELDFIGLNCYYPLSTKDHPGKRELQKAFAGILEKAEMISKKYNRPLVLTEVGFRSVEGSWKNPHAEASGRDFDPHCQQICYEVLFEGISGKEWIHGLFIWKWPSFLDHQNSDPIGFTPNGKPAEETVKNWYSEKLGK